MKVFQANTQCGSHWEYAGAAQGGVGIGGLAHAPILRNSICCLLEFYGVGRGGEGGMENNQEAKL